MYRKFLCFYSYKIFVVYTMNIKFSKFEKNIKILDKIRQLIEIKNVYIYVREMQKASSRT